jgi:hypothetical protein
MSDLAAMLEGSRGMDAALAEDEASVDSDGQRWVL